MKFLTQFHCVEANRMQGDESHVQLVQNNTVGQNNQFVQY